MMQAPHKERAHRPRHQTGGIDRHPGPLSTALPYAVQPSYSLVHRSGQRALVHTLEEAVQRGEIGHAPQAEDLRQFVVPPRAYLRFAKGPAPIRLQTQDGQNVRLGEQALTKGSPIEGQHRAPHSPVGEGQDASFAKGYVSVSVKVVSDKFN